MTAPAKPNRKPEAKVVAGTGGGILGGALTTFVLWCLGAAVWDAPSDAAHSAAALAAVPLPVSALIVAVVPAVFAFAGAYWAPHTHRPDLADETLPVIQPVAVADEQTRSHLEQIDHTLTEMQADLHHTGPIDPIPDQLLMDGTTQRISDHGLRIMDEAHD
jgi:hypothetical protein